MKKLILFDIDGTLISGAHGHIEAFAIAFKQVYDVDASIYMTNPNGMTDQQIILEVLQTAGLDTDTIESKMGECMEAMTEYFSAIKPKLNVQIFPGVVDLLKRLHDNGEVIGLVTGNLEPIARGKMEIAGINEYFTLGGFGSDGRERSELVKNAIKEAQIKDNLQINGNVYLVGDTPLDISAALAGGAKPIGVTTGSFNKVELKEAGAERIIDSLTKVQDFMSLLN